MKSILRRNDTPEDLQNSREKVMEKAFESLPLEGGAFRVFRKDEKGRLKVLGVLPFDEVTNPDEFIGTVEGRWGGGKYYVLPTKSGKKSAEGFYVEFDSEPKRPKKRASNGEDDSADKRSGKKSQVERELEKLKQKLEAREQDNKLRLMIREEIQGALPKTDGAQAKLVNGILSNFPSVVAGLSGIMGNRETAADMLEKVSTIWTNIEGSMPRSPDPVEQARSLAELLFSLVDRVKPPPVTAGGSSSGLASFISAFADQLGRKFMADQAQAQGQPAAALPSMQQLQQAQPGFSGIPTQAPQGTPEATTQATQTTQGKQTTSQKPGVNAASIFQAIGIDPAAKLRAMVRGRADPREIADAVIYVFEFVGNFMPPNSPFSPYITGFIDNPEENFDRACTSIPELVELAQQDPEYLARLRGAIIERVQQYRLQIQQAFSDAQANIEGEAPEPERRDVVLNQEPEPAPK